MSDTFSIALAEILRVEGGYVNDPRDSGKATNRGITQLTYDSWRMMQGLPPRSVKYIEDDEVEAIYREMYWDRVAAEWDWKGHPGIALYLFDSAVQHGTGWAEGLAEEVGDALHIVPLIGLAHAHAIRCEYYTKLKSWYWAGRSWIRRVSTIYRRSVELEHPGGLIRVQMLDLDGVRYKVKKARWVGKKLFVKKEVGA